MTPKEKLKLQEHVEQKRQKAEQLRLKQKAARQETRRLKQRILELEKALAAKSTPATTTAPKARPVFTQEMADVIESLPSGKYRQSEINDLINQRLDARLGPRYLFLALHHLPWERRRTAPDGPLRNYITLPLTPQELNPNRETPPEPADSPRTHTDS